MSGTPDPTVTVGGPDAWSTTPPAIDGDWRDLFVTTFYDLGIEPYLRPQLIFDQFATPRNSRTTHNGQTRRIFFVDDLDAATTPLVENRDIDAVALSGLSLDVTQREYGNAVRRTELVKGFSMVPFDPIAVERLGFNAGLTMDTLARTAAFQTTLAMNNPDGTTVTGHVAQLQPKINASPGYLSSDVLTEGVVMLQQQFVDPYDDREFVLLTGPRGWQHLMAENANAGFREVLQFNNGASGNSIFTGEVGTYQGIRIVVDNRLTNTATLFGRDAFVKIWPMIDGFGPMAGAVVSPVIDTLRRFAAFGWKWTGGYSLFRPQASVQITFGDIYRAFGAVNTSITETAYYTS